MRTIVLEINSMLQSTRTIPMYTVLLWTRLGYIDIFVIWMQCVVGYIDPFVIQIRYIVIAGSYCVKANQKFRQDRAINSH